MPRGFSPHGGRSGAPAPATPPPAFAIAGTRFAAPPLAAGLYVVATPIGNLDDITLRALKVLAAADLVVCEDSRVTRRLLAAYAIRARLAAYHEHNAGKVRPALLARLAAGASLALVSDAGTPLVSDPGYRLVGAALAAGHAVVPVPGPSAPLAALSVSGLPTDRFFFEGFLPPRPAARRRRLQRLRDVPATLVVFESPRRLAACLADMADTLGPRAAVIARELTKRFEELRRAPLDALAAACAAAPAPKGEVVLLVAPPGADQGAPADRDSLDAVLGELLAGMSLRDAADAAAARLGLSRKETYGRALALAGRGRDGAP